LKKFLSVLLTMAMVMSLFTGTVLAAPATTTVNIAAGTPSYELKLDGWVGADAVVSYTIFNNSAKTAGTAVKAETNITVGTDDSITINTSSLTTGAPETKYYLDVVSTAGTHSVVINVHYTLTINGSTDAPKVNLNQATVLSGLLTNNGVAVKDTVVSFRSTTAVLGLTTTAADGSFSMTVTVSTAADYFVSVGPLPTPVDYVKVAFNAVDSINVKVDAKPATLRSGTTTASFSFTDKTGTSALTGVTAGFHLINVITPNGEVLVDVLDAIASPYKATNLDLKTGPGTTSLKAGTYTVQIVLYLDSVAGIGSQKITDATAKRPYASGTTTFTIVDNTNELYTVVDVAGATKDVPVSKTAQAVNLNFTAPGTKLIKKVVYSVEGPLVAKQSQTVTLTGSVAEPYMSNVVIPTADLYKDGSNVAVAGKTILVKNDGVIKISGTITYSDDTTETFEKNITVKGYMVSFTPDTTMYVQDEVTLKAVVTDENGNAISNARVTWTSTDFNAAANVAFREWDTTTSAFKAASAAVGTLVVNGRDVVILNGEYSQKVKLSAPAIVSIMVETYDATAGTWSLYAYSTLKVEGEQVYTAASTYQLIAAKNTQTLSVQILDTNGNAVVPTYAYVDGKGLVPSAEYLALGASPAVYNATKKAVDFTFNTAASTGTFTIYLGTNVGAKMVAIPVSVVAPSVVVKVNGVESNVVTAGLSNKIELAFADKNATINLQAIAGLDKVAVVSSTSVDPTVSVGVGTVTITPRLTGTNKEGKFEIQAKFNGGATITVATITVKEPVMDLGGLKDLEISNVVDVPLTLTDANGAPIKKQVITPSGAVLTNTTFTTDDAGKVTLTLSPNTVGKLTLTATGLWTSNTPAEFAVTIPVVRDVKGPVVALEEVYTVNTSTATISFNVTDGSRVTEVWVGFDKAMVRPDGSTIFTFTNLNVGVNEFDVLAYDEYGNSTEATMVVEYLKPSTVVLTIGSFDATLNGAAMTGMDQEPLIVNGRTFLPVRFVFVNLLGGTIEWDANTQTITSVVKGNTIKMVIGSKTAYVNGDAVALLEAPYIEASTGRTLVPMREIMEAIGISLDWNANTRTVTLNIPQ